MEELDIKDETTDAPTPAPEEIESQGPAFVEVATPEGGAPDAASTAEPMALSLEEAVPTPVAISDAQLQAVLEAVVYIAEEPLTLAQIASALTQPVERVESILRRLMEEFEKAEHGIGIREVAGGFKMATKAEHHEAVRSFVKSLKPPLKLSLPALETLAVIAYKQPVTQPEIMAIRGVQGGGVLKTLLDRKLIAGAGRKNVIGKPILYKTTKEFLIQFGLKDIAELPSLKEFEEIRRMAFADSETEPPVAATPVEAKTEGPAEEDPPATEPETEPATQPAAHPAHETEPPAAAAPVEGAPLEPKAEASAEPEAPPATEPETEPATPPATHPAHETEPPAAAAPMETALVEPKTEASAEPGVPPVTEPETEPATQPAMHPAHETEPPAAAAPVQTALVEPKTEAPVEPGAPPATEPETEPATQPATHPANQLEPAVVAAPVETVPVVAKTAAAATLAEAAPVEPETDASAEPEAAPASAPEPES